MAVTTIYQAVKRTGRAGIKPDVEPGPAIAELIASLSKPSVSLVLGGGHSIGGPIASREPFCRLTAVFFPIRHISLLE